MRVIGFPWIPGNVTYNEGLDGGRIQTSGQYSNCYFLESSVEVGGQMGLVHLSGFATYTVLHGKGALDVSVVPPPALAPQPFTNFGFDRQNWMVGGKLVIGLNTPL